MCFRYLLLSGRRCIHIYSRCLRCTRSFVMSLKFSGRNQILWFMWYHTMHKYVSQIKSGMCEGNILLSRITASVKITFKGHRTTWIVFLKTQWSVYTDLHFISKSYWPLVITCDENRNSLPKRRNFGRFIPYL
jgi:hypothetical protein